jgi:hypothetical protein
MSEFSRGLKIFEEGLTQEDNATFRELQEENFLLAFWYEFDNYKKKKNKNKTDLKKIAKAAINRYFDEFNK